jgi:hypothetical protein
MRVGALCEGVGVVAASIILAAATSPLAFRAARVGPVTAGDGQMRVWTVAWVARAPVLDPLHVHDATIFAAPASSLTDWRSSSG